MALGKGIPLINGFDLNSKLPLDNRTVANTVEEMNKLVTDGSVGDGQLCYCKADKKLYVLKDGIWSEVGGGGGSSIPVVEGTINEASSETEVIINIPQAQTKPFILHIEAMESYILMSVIMGAYLGYLYEGRNEKVAYIFQGADTTIDVSITNPIVPIVNATNTDNFDRYTIPSSQELAFILHIEGPTGISNVFMSASNDGTLYYYYGIEAITSDSITYLYGSNNTVQRYRIKISGGSSVTVTFED